MHNIQYLLEGTNAARGFIGSEIRDDLPHLSLTEAVSQLPCIIVESQSAFARSRFTDRRSINEAAGVVPLTEAAIGTLKERIDRFFERMLKWIRSIIAKLKIQIQKIYLSSEDLYNRYADKLGTDADYRELTFEGYRFAQGSKTIFALKDNFDMDIEGLIRQGLQKAGVRNVMLPAAFGREMNQIARKTPEGEMVDPDQVEDLVDRINEISDLDRDDRSTAMASILTGRTMVGDWEADIRRQAWGEKGEIHYGSDMFTPKLIGQVLKDKSLSECLAGYQKLERAIMNYRSNLKAEIQDLYSRYLEETNVMNLAGNLSAHMIVNRYYNAYISVVSDALDATARLKAIKVSFHTEMRRQAVAMLIKLVNKGAEPVNDNYTGEEDWT